MQGQYSPTTLTVPQLRLTSAMLAASSQEELAQKQACEQRGNQDFDRLFESSDAPAARRVPSPRSQALTETSMQGATLDFDFSRSK